VESYDILPDEELWANQYALFKFADNPNEHKNGQSVGVVLQKVSHRHPVRIKCLTIYPFLSFFFFFTEPGYRFFFCGS